MHFDMQRGTNIDVGCSRFKFKHFARASVISGNVTIYLEGLADMAASNWFTSMVENNP